MEAELRHHLTELATGFAGARKIGMGTVARLATGDWRFFERLDGGASFTARKYDLIMAWFVANWPDGTAWPAGVPRPDVQVDDALDSEAAAAAKGVMHPDGSA